MVFDGWGRASGWAARAFRLPGSFFLALEFADGCAAGPGDPKLTKLRDHMDMGNRTHTAMNWTTAIVLGRCRWASAFQVVVLIPA